MMKQYRYQIIFVVVAVILIILLLIGQQPQFVAELEGGPAPTSGGLYVEALVGNPSRFNPILDDFNPIDKDVNAVIYSSLFNFDAHGNPKPDLVENWGVSVNGDVFNITLYDDIEWHDGESLTTADVLFTIELMRTDQMPVARDISELWNSVEVIVFDDYTMQFNLSEPYVPFLDYLDFGVLPAHLLAGKSVQEFIDAPFNLSPVGSGPFMFEELLVENGGVNGVVLAAYDDYHRERPFIDQVVFRYFATAEAALLAYQNNEVMGLSLVDDSILHDVLAEPNLNVYTTRAPEMGLVMLNLANTDVPFFSDTAVRKALLSAINRRWIISEVFDGQAILANGPIFPGSWAYYEDLETVEFDSELAIEMLLEQEYRIPAEGGQTREKEGVFLSFELLYPDTPEHKQVAELIQANWALIGVQAELVSVDYATLVSGHLATGEYEAALVDLNFIGSPDPDPYPFWHQAEINGGQNYSAWNNRRGSEYLEQARTTPNFQERLRLYRNFQIHFTRETPALLLYYPVYSYAVADQVQGIALGPLFETSDRFNSINEWYLVSTEGTDVIEIETPVGE